MATNHQIEGDGNNFVFSLVLRLQQLPLCFAAET